MGVIWDLYANNNHNNLKHKKTLLLETQLLTLINMILVSTQTTSEDTHALYSKTFASYIKALCSACAILDMLQTGAETHICRRSV